MTDMAWKTAGAIVTTIALMAMLTGCAPGDAGPVGSASTTEVEMNVSDLRDQLIAIPTIQDARISIQPDGLNQFLDVAIVSTTGDLDIDSVREAISVVGSAAGDVSYVRLSAWSSNDDLIDLTDSLLALGINSADIVTGTFVARTPVVVPW
ncbi:MAG: hypothetical protein IE935_04140 [Micrococcales bacterium]|nr:hypothetical protein [Micrococcales bacterium]